MMGPELWGPRSFLFQNIPVNEGFLLHMKTLSLLQSTLQESRKRTDAIFALIKPESLYLRPIPERHRLIFYLGHLEAFDWNQLCRWTLDIPSFHPEFDALFEAGIDPREGELPQDDPSDWPSVEEVHTYNAHVRHAIDGAIEDVSPDMVQVIIEHRLMHAETTAYLMQHMNEEGKINPGVVSSFSRMSPELQMVHIPGGSITLGQNPTDGFGWDNEFSAHILQVQDFHISKYKVTNGQYLQFVEEGAPPPPFWAKVEGQWVIRTMFGYCELPLDWPVYVSQQEALAYAQWQGMALPSESQYHRAAYGTFSDEERLFPWGNSPPNGRQGNFNFKSWDPHAVTADPEGDSAFGVSQMLGNGWEWTSTEFHPFEGFAPMLTYPGYSTRFFDHDHYVVKGAGPQTASCFLRRSFRNWFRTGYPHAHVGFRCVSQ